ncbi:MULTISPECIES: MazG nucleotide pyrophosphohydrolase domain-containing protein [Burkholderia cepacia complex]|uniref:MazG nucleotide pyrophosphohydrolase domain-containing protein n=1 Tax=Burkholderia cepacia complex TaxID=87882 RepID=UPI001594D623|nr:MULTISPECIES: MazG nucleotide pyrophosphohydrolase domain-containing protein [Burkholderia cepacia complex]MBR8006545.1 hypothetical protein [Burkholderia vietnamiensis]MDN8042344.1 MazG nucleotide pyrophosphohydrolase domain-containing protein [Burkholderia vietnamiensis]HDR9131355.1 hypothetical protein [Burkholderia vietnamiensis]
MRDLTGALQHLASEGGEVAQAAIKAIQFGLITYSQLSKKERNALEQELGDVFALGELLMRHNVIRSERVHDRTQMKLNSYGRKYG